MELHINFKIELVLFMCEPPNCATSVFWREGEELFPKKDF